MEAFRERAEFRENINLDRVTCLLDLLGQVEATQIRGFDSLADAELIESLRLAQTGSSDDGVYDFQCLNDDCDYECSVTLDQTRIKVVDELGDPTCLETPVSIEGKVASFVMGISAEVTEVY